MQRCTEIPFTSELEWSGQVVRREEHAGVNVEDPSFWLMGGQKEL